PPPSLSQLSASPPLLLLPRPPPLLPTTSPPCLRRAIANPLPRDPNPARGAATRPSGAEPGVASSSDTAMRFKVVPRALSRVHGGGLRLTRRCRHGARIEWTPEPGHTFEGTTTRGGKGGHVAAVDAGSSARLRAGAAAQGHPLGQGVTEPGSARGGH
ncbi:unnamed protein product, partial [Urochloa humidicola]